MPNLILVFLVAISEPFQLCPRQIFG
jgi:hypothetical protein